MRVLLLGGTGLTGTEVRRAAPEAVTLDTPSRAVLDATDAYALERAFAAHPVDWVINCAAFTAVDAAEADPDGARALNVELPARLARLARASGARLLHLSTDYVFGDGGTRPWREDDVCAPIGVYARSKYDGERRVLESGAEVLVLRTAGLFGPARTNFPLTMWRRAKQGMPSRVVADQHGAPTSAADLAEWIWALIAREARGLFHATNAGETTWAAVAERVYARALSPAAAAGLVTPVTSAAYNAPARRPSYSVLDGTKLESTLGITRRRWDVALDEFLTHLERGDAR